MKCCKHEENLLLIRTYGAPFFLDLFSHVDGSFKCMVWHGVWVHEEETGDLRVES